MKCFYHHDLDGHAAAAIVKQLIPEAVCISVDYKDDFPFDQIEPGEEAWIVDFSLQKDGDWQRLMEITLELVWIDHHETSIKKAEGKSWEDLPGVRSTGRCGAWLTWIWTHEGTTSIPRAIALVDAWDRWVHEDAPEVLNFVSGMETVNMAPDSEMWIKLLSDNDGIVITETGNVFRHKKTLDMVMESGEFIEDYKNRQHHKYLATYGHDLEWLGYRCKAVNRGLVNSRVFGEDIHNYDICVGYVYDGKTWTVHLYSEKVKVNDLAVQFGGGGHPGAAGFVCEELPW